MGVIDKSQSAIPHPEEWHSRNEPDNNPTGAIEAQIDNFSLMMLSGVRQSGGDARKTYRAKPRTYEARPQRKGRKH
jgi:hypothetical protein